jgi:putative endonuclease
MADPRHQLGRRAEDAVAAWLVRRGWVVLARCWRSSRGELDLVCVDDRRTLVAVEVKLRRTGRAGTGAEALDRRRLVRLRHALAEYAVRSETPWSDLRIDLVTATPADGAWRLSRMAAVDQW